MRLSITILSTLALSVLADKHRLCCCTGPNPKNTATICRSDISQKIVDEGGGKYIKSIRGFYKDTNSPEMPLEGNSSGKEAGQGYVCFPQVFFHAA